MNDAEFQQLIEQARRRPLDAEEERQLRAFLAAHPEKQTAWDEETALNRLLARLPDTPMPSNFTAQVLAAVEREEAAAARTPRPAWTNWLPLTSWRPAALVATLVLAGLIPFFAERHRVEQRAQLARSLAAVSPVAQVPTVEMLQDFEAIRRLGQRAKADEDLLALFQLPQ
jgi:anti-sigma factor RsiW